MLRRLKMIGLVVGVIVALSLVIAIPAFAGGPPSPGKYYPLPPKGDDDNGNPPGYYGYGRTLPCTNCDVPFSEGVYRLVDLNAAARVLGLEADDVSNTLWAGGTLADLINEQDIDGRYVRDAVDAERYRALVNSDYMREDRPELCCEGDCCPSACVDSQCSCVEACDPKCGGSKPSPWYRDGAQPLWGMR
jgi:hypothetical protein